MFKICPKYTLGLTATPDRKRRSDPSPYWFLGPELFRAERHNQKKTKVVTLHYMHDMYKEAPPVTRFGKLNMAAMMTAVSEIPERNELIIETARKAAHEGRRVLVLSDRRDHCFALHGTIGSTSGLYIGGMKESELNESAQKPIIIETFSWHTKGSIYLHWIQSSLQRPRATLNNR
jgi:hypothetical protein